MMNTPTKHLPQGAAAAASTSSRTHLVFGAPPTPSSDPSYASASASSSSAATASAAAITAAGLTPAPVTTAGTPSSPVSAIIDMLHDSARALFEYLRLTNALQPGSIAEADRAKVATIVQHLTVVFNAAEGNQEQALTAAAVRQLAKLNGISPQELDEYDQHMLIQAAGGAGAGMGMHNMSHDEADATGSHSGSDEMDNDSLAAAGTGKKKPGRKPGPKPKGALGAVGILNKPSFKSSPSSSSHASPSGGSTLGGDGTKKVRGPRTALIRWSDEEWSFLQQQVIENGRNFSKIMSMHGPEGSLTQTLKRFEVKHLANKWANERAKRERSGLPRLPEKKLLGEEAVAADKAESAADAGDMSEIREFEGDADADGGDTVGMSSGATTPVSRGGGGGASALGLQAESGEDAHMSEAQDDEEDELMDDV